MIKTIISPLVLRNFLFIILILTKAHELLSIKKKYDVRVRAKKPLLFDDLDVTPTFLQEKNIQSILPFLPHIAGFYNSILKQMEG